MKTKFGIGCLVQWYEVEIIEEYLESLKDAINHYDSNKVLVDIVVVCNQELEEAFSEEILNQSVEKIEHLIRKYIPECSLTKVDNLVTIADYRRRFNDTFCELVDVLVWGESDMLVPKQAFIALDQLHQGIETTKYLATFGICKMWDPTWKPLEHPDFTDKPFIEGDTKNWWSLRYKMSKEEMNVINDKVDTLKLSIIQPHKFNGCGLVISSEVIKAGVNIPKSIFFIHEDTALMLMTQKILGQIPQYHLSNILLVHNRKHPNKRTYIKGEEGIEKTDTGTLRRVHTWYEKANKMCEKNCYNLFNPNYTSYTWEDVWS